MDVDNEDRDNSFRILVATDTHLGYMERNGHRGEDSFNTFEEVLKLAHEHEVDFVLLGGDLFHENKPSKNSMVKCIRLLKKYCLGDRPVRFEYISDPSENFSVQEPRVNYRDPHLNIGLPVFSIHGNHDDLSGVGDTAALDLLAEAGLLNYFGRHTDLTRIKVSPILLQKGKARLALYGLSNIKDERLYRLVRAKRVELVRPREHTEDWFNVMVLHQNRVKHGPCNYLPPEFIDRFVDVVIWGHEHENRIEPEYCEASDLHIIQPGSSVATSLCEGEARSKSVGLLCVRADGKFRLNELPLQTVRPLVFETLRLGAGSNPPPLGQLTQQPQHQPQPGNDFDVDRALPSDVEDHVTLCVEQMIERAKNQLTGHPRQPQLPLVRLRVEYPPHLPMFHPARFGQKFTDRVANPDELVLLRKAKTDSHIGKTSRANLSLLDQAMQKERESGARVEDFVRRFFSEQTVGGGLSVLSEAALSEAVRQCVDKGHIHAFGIVVAHQLKAAVGYLVEQQLLEVSDETVREQLQQRRRQPAAPSVGALPSSPPAQTEVRRILDATLDSANVAHPVSDADSDHDAPMEVDNAADNYDASVRGRGGAARRRGRRSGGATRTRGGRRGRGSARGSTSTRLDLTQQTEYVGGGRMANSSASSRSQLSLDSFMTARDSHVSRVAPASVRGGSSRGVVFDSDSD